MTISSTNRKAGPYTGNGTATVFPFAFKVFQASDLDVVRLDTTLNVETNLTLTTDYTVVLNGDQDSNPGGSLTLVAGALASGFTLTITSDIANLQPTDLTNQGGFYPDVINDALDRATIQIQQLQEQVNRSLKVAISSTADVTLPPPAANDLIGWDATGTNLANIDPATLATVVAYATAYADVFLGDGVTQSWLLTRNPGSLYNLDVSINGSSQEPIRDYTFTGTTFTMTTPPPINSRVLVKYKEGLPNYSGDSQDIRYLPAGTGAVAETVQTKLRETVSVKDFGAVGDGVTDDTAAMQSAHNSGNVIYYPAGIYLFSKLATPINYGGIIGDGPTMTILKSIDVSSDDLFIFDGRWENYFPNKDNSAFIFKNFSVTADITKSGGACIKVTAPIAGTQRENQWTVFDNVMCRDFYTGIHFESASFWKVIACNFVSYAKAGILVENLYNSDSGDGSITNCIFETNATSAGSAGVLQYSSGGVKITGCKFLGATYGYRMEWNGTNSSNLQISNSSFELMQYAAISFLRASGSATFKLITITGNEIALTTAGIISDSNTWLSQITVVGNVIETWGNYSTSTEAIGFNNLDNFIISNNNLDGLNGGSLASVGISLVNPTNGQIGLNNYTGFDTAITQSGATPAIIQFTTQSNEATTSASGWTAYGSLYKSTSTAVVFNKPFVTSPNPWDITLTAGDGTRTVGAILDSVSATGFSFTAVAINNTGASTVYWTAKGIV